MVINDQDHDVEELIEQDFPEEAPETVQYTISQVKLSKAVNVKTSAPQGDQIFAKIRPGLLALKQFESVYILARWIKNFFMDILNRPSPAETEEAQRPPINSNGDDIDGEGTGVEMRNSSADQIPDIQRNTAPASQATHDVAVFEDHGFTFDQSSY
ncbi:cutinase transcription factor 1 beta [Fusarium bulbicola]|nr:cutinase transcription factor 1 beta [Fusarium bulbicola]